MAASEPDILTSLLVVGAALGIYLAPAIIAIARKVVNVWSVVVVNVFLGWTLIGWVVALAMSVRTSTTAKPAGG
jgi:hypothetical protein